MPVPGTNISEENILGMLFKKHENLVNTNPSQSFKLEPNTNARPRVFPTEQLIAQDIPKNDTDLPLPRYLTRDTNYTQKIAGGPGATNPYAKRSTSTKYPYIALYERILLTEKEIGISYFYSANGSNIFNAANNILTDAIPYTYDTNGTYNIKIEFFTGNPAELFVEIAPNNINYPWLIDTDGGIVTFYCTPPVSVTYPVYISFWRYEGTKGLIAASSSNKLEPSVILPNRTNFTFSNEINIKNSPGNPDTITTAFAKMDDWFFTNMISQPPAPKKEGELTTPTEVRVMFSGPTQIYLLDMHVPVIKYINSDIIITTPTPSQTITALNKSTSFIPQATKVDGIVISKLAGNSGIETRETTTNGTLTTYRVYVYYNPALASNPTFTLEIWYTNDSSYLPNKLSVPGLSFQAAYPPSAPTMNTPQTQSSSQINISWTQPQYVMYDSATGSSYPTASTSDPTIQNYLVTYIPTSTTRYPGLVNTTANIFTSTSTVSQPLTGLLPGTTYTINTKARNTANAAYGPASADITGTTNLPTLLNLPLGQTIFTTSLTNGNIAQVGDTALISDPIFIEGDTPISSLYSSIPVHTQANAGSTASGIATLELSNNMQTLSMTLDGFPAKTYNDVSSSSLEITNIKTADLYLYPSTFTQSQGFYLTAQARFKLKNLPNASSTRQTVTIKPNNVTYDRKYYVEKAQAGQPTLTFAPIELPSTSMKLISGIPTLGSTAANKTITCYIDASNIGTYFYRRSGIFDIYGTPYITQHVQIDLPSSVTAPITAPVPFTVSLPMNITPTDYARGFTIKARAHNGVISGQEQSEQVRLLIDSASYNASFPATPPDPTNGFVTGMRCVIAEPDVEPVPGTLEVTNTTYYDISNILTPLDLPYLHGKYQVRDSQANTNTDFVDYRDYGGSDLMPLQNESGFRWVTYAWKIPLSSKTINTMKIKLSNFTNTINLRYSDIYNTLQVLNGSQYIENNIIKIYYRLEEINDIGANINTSASTIWMDATKRDAGGNMGYYNSNDRQKKSLNGIYKGVNTIELIQNTNPNDIVCNVFVPSITYKDINIYVRIGMSMDAYGVSFTSVECQYT